MKTKSDSRKRAHRQRGLAAVEIACGSLFMCVLLLLAIDVSVLMLGYEVNDKACRDACRAAAQQSSSAEAINAAQAILKTHQTDGSFVTQPVLVTGSNNFQYQDFGGNPLAGNPTVTVTTECRVKTPVPLVFVGSNFGHDGSWVNDYWTFRKKYTFPIVTFSLQLP